MAPKKPQPTRAPRGSVKGSAVLVRMPPAMAEATAKAAKQARLSLSEWWRRAGQAALDAATSSPRR